VQFLYYAPIQAYYCYDTLVIPGAFFQLSRWLFTGIVLDLLYPYSRRSWLLCQATMVNELSTHEDQAM